MRQFIPAILIAATAISVAQTTMPSPKATTIASQPAPATAPAATQDATPLDPKWTDLLARLTAEETRDAAKKELAELPNGQRESLARLVPVASTPEIKSLLQARVLEMEIDAAINPPPVSIQLKNASLDEIAKALNKILGTSYDVWPPNDNSGTCTLKMDNAPFWEIFSEITKQVPLSIQDYGENVKLTRGGSPLNNITHIKGGIAIAPMSITRTSTVDFRQPEGKQAKPPILNFSLALMVDPRVKIVAAQTYLTEVVDDNGNVLLKQKTGSLDQSWHHTGPQWQNTFTLSAPDNLGTKITSAKGVAKLNVALESLTVEVDDFEKAFKKPITLGKKKITFTQFKIDGSQLNYSIQDEQRGFFGGSGSTRMTMTILDANGAVIRSDLIQGSSNASIGIGHDIDKPVKLRLSMTTRTKEVPFNFELKDLPLPPK